MRSSSAESKFQRPTEPSAVKHVGWRMAGFDKPKVRKEFAESVNMTASELRDWLTTDESRKVGWKGKDGDAAESVGHASGRRIVELLGKKAGELSDNDYAHMRKVVGYVRRHCAQRPENIYTSRWRYSLMNWGHDPCRD
jgi:hypothetical protein